MLLKSLVSCLKVWSYSLKSPLEEVYHAERFGLSYQIIFVGQSESCQYTFCCQNLSIFCCWEMIEIGLLNGYFWSQIDVYRKYCYHLKPSCLFFQWPSKVLAIRPNRSIIWGISSSAFFENSINLDLSTLEFIQKYWKITKICNRFS